MDLHRPPFLIHSIGGDPECKPIESRQSQRTIQCQTTLMWAESQRQMTWSVRTVQMLPLIFALIGRPENKRMHGIWLINAIDGCYRESALRSI